MIPLPWKWFKKNFSLVLLLAATGCLALALGEVIRGITWSLLMPVSLLAVIAGWGIGASRLSPKHAWGVLSAVGIAGVFVYVAGLGRPLSRLLQATIALIPQMVHWAFERVLVDAGPLLEAWAALSAHATSIFGRLWVWCAALLAGKTVVDPVAAGLVWNLLLWLVAAWEGWQLRRNRHAFVALAPGAVMLALVLDYTRGDAGLVVVYLAIMLALMGLASNERLHLQWQRRKVDYSDSIAFESLIMVGLVTTVLVLSAAFTPSLSWRDLIEKLREAKQGGEDPVAESLGLEAPPNVANDNAYRGGGLPRQHLLNLPPDQLEDVVLIISTGELPPIPEIVHDIHPNHYYWRAITYDLYSGVGWGSSAAQSVQVPANTVLLALPQDHRIVNQNIKRMPGQKTSLVWTGILAQADADIEIAWRTKPPPEPSPRRNGDMLGALTEVEEYTVVSYVPEIDASQLRAAGSDYPAEITRRYLQLPETTPERVLRLARELTQAALTPYDRAVSIESYLRTFPYTLDVGPPPSGRDVVDYFLFTAQQGYCDYYATSMVVLARAIGLPSRVVVGYASGEYNSQTAEYIIRQQHAHTWVEVYFSEIGWVEFEPTAGQPPINRPQGENASEPHLPAGQQAISWLKAQWRGLVAHFGGQILIACFAVFLLVNLWQMGETGFLHLIPSQRAISRMYSRLEKTSSYLLPDLPGGHTPYQLQFALANRLSGAGNTALRAMASVAENEIERVISLYVMQLFSPHPPTKPQIRRAIRSWAKLRWRLWFAIGCDRLQRRLLRS